MRKRRVLSVVALWLALIALVFIFLGTLTSSDLVWELSDMFNNLMVIPNAIALFALTGLVVKHVNGTPEADRWE